MGAPVNYHYFGVGSAYVNSGMLPYAASFNASGTSLTGTNAPDGAADIQSTSVTLTGNTIGTNTNPIELSRCFNIANCAPTLSKTLTSNNNGGSTFLRVSDIAYTYVSLKNINSLGEHHIWWSNGDHIDFLSDNTVAYNIATISGDTSNSSTGYAAVYPTGINTSHLSSNVNLYATNGLVTFDTNSVNTNFGSFVVQAFGSGAVADFGKIKQGDIIYGTHVKDGLAEITAGAVTLNSNNTTTPTIS